MILVIEDNEADIMMLEMALAKAGGSAPIQSITDGAEARVFVDQTVDNPPDLILLDLNLHKADGITVLAQLRRNESFKSVPVVVWSSTRSPKDLESVMALGANDFWLKPSNLDDWRGLGQRVSALLKLREAPVPNEAGVNCL
mgnify:CR=1 FL=1